jgi:hypothetical protein
LEVPERINDVGFWEWIGRDVLVLSLSAFGPMLLKKDYEGGLLATLIQDQEQMRNHDSRNHMPGFVRFNF